MFSVKATYNNETRKLTFKESTFPSFVQICSQLYRVFPISGSYYFSKLLFCPSEGTRVIVGKEVHNEAEYKSYITPFVGRAWPGGVLRFNIVDETPHKLPQLQRQSSISSWTAAHSEASQTTSHGIPIAPAPFFTVSSSTAPAADQQRIDLAAHLDIADLMSANNRNSTISKESDGTCCSLNESKQELRSLMSNFLADFNKIASSNFGDVFDGSPAAATPRLTPTPLKTPAVPNVEYRDGGDNVCLPIPGAFVQPVPQSPAATVPPSVATQSNNLSEGILHPGVTCDHCGGPVRGLRFKCRICLDYDLCEKCMARDNAITDHRAIYQPAGSKAIHEFNVIAAPVASSSSQRTNPQGSVHLNPVVHTGISCDVCNRTIVGRRHKCLDCPDFDACDNCISRVSATHEPQHQFFVLEQPGRVVVHRVFQEDNNLRPAFSSHHEGNTGRNTEVVHHANCDLCDSVIVGARYKCLTCPDYDTCGQCITITNEQHPRHKFVKITDVQHLAPSDSAAYVRHRASCNACGKGIRGIRYKCMHPDCPDYDLCPTCEALPIAVHPSNHPMLKMRDPNTVIPTVYRFGGTSLINDDIPQCSSRCQLREMGRTSTVDASVVASEPVPVKVEVSVQKSQPETFDASVSTNSRVQAVQEVPSRQLSPAPIAAFENFQLLADYFRSSARDSSALDHPSPQSEMVERSKVEVKASQPVDLLSSLPPLLSRLSMQTAPAQVEYKATFIDDGSVEDGQVFPAGAEFIKSWRMQNDGDVAWPSSTIIKFVAGDRMPAFEGAPTRYHVGKTVEAGEFIDVCAMDLKAPEAPGRYIGYWKLTDDTGKSFGQSVWCDIVVAEPEIYSQISEESSLSSSKVIMPEAATSRVQDADAQEMSTPATHVEELDAVLSPVPSTPTLPPSDTSADSSEAGDSSASLLDEFETASDEELWEATRSQVTYPAQTVEPHDAEYVVLYDYESSDDE